VGYLFARGNSWLPRHGKPRDPSQAARADKTCLPNTAEKERQKAEKAKKFAEKQAKKQTGAGEAAKAVKVAKTTEEIPKYVEKTPEGEKKSELVSPSA